MDNRIATTLVVPVHPLIAERWSPRSLDPGHELSDSELLSLLEAARWAPSSSNRQPSRFIAGRRGDETFREIFDALDAGNQKWATNASALIAVVVNELDGDVMRRDATYDVGLAAGQLVLQAHSLGLYARQMGGFDRGQIEGAFPLAPGQRPVVVIAVGAMGDSNDTSHAERQRPVRPRERLPLTDLVIGAPVKRRA